MDYEKAYKAVLQTATQWIKDGCTDKEKICLECVFPELRESEDERIRKEIIEHINDQIHSFISPPDCRDKYEEEELARYKSWIAYLEKQKEQEPAWSEEDERVLKGIIGKIDHDQTYGVSKAEMLSFLKSIRPSWKPSEGQMSMLLAVINDPNNAGSASCQLALRGIYEQLKNL